MLNTVLLEIVNFVSSAFIVFVYEETSTSECVDLLRFGLEKNLKQVFHLIKYARTRVLYDLYILV